MRHDAPAPAMPILSVRTPAALGVWRAGVPLPETAQRREKARQLQQLLLLPLRGQLAARERPLAMKTYQQCAAALQRELGIASMAETRQLYRQLAPESL